MAGVLAVAVPVVADTVWVFVESVPFLVVVLVTGQVPNLPRFEPVGQFLRVLQFANWLG